MTLVEVARRVGITAQSLSNAENGRQDPAIATIERIAAALDFPVEFLTASDIDELDSAQVSFRARSKTPARARNAVLSAARIAIEFREWIDERFILPSVDVPTVDKRMPPELAAEHVRSRWGLDLLCPVSNCIHLMEAHGIAVFSLPPEYADVDAFSFRWRDRPFIMLSTLKTAERSRFDAAHELGHLVMHQEHTYDADWRTAEREANQFASAFLMPRPSVLHYFKPPATTDRIIRSKAKWQVAALALAYRLHEVGILTEWSYRQTIIALGRLGYRSAEPDGIVRETSQVLGKVLSVLRREGTSLGGIARELFVTPSEVKSLVFGLVVTSAGAAEEIATDAPSPQRPAELRLVQG